MEYLYYIFYVNQIFFNKRSKFFYINNHYWVNFVFNILAWFFLFKPKSLYQEKKKKNPSSTTNKVTFGSLVIAKYIDTFYYSMAYIQEHS